MTLKAWPTVTNRNVAQPSRVRLATAPEVGADVYDVTPVPGTVTAEGTLINEALFSGEKAYVDQNDVPVVTATSTNGVAYTATVPEWQGMTAAEMNGRTLVVVFTRASTSTACTLNINSLGAAHLYVSSGTSTGGAVSFPISAFLSANSTAVMKYDSVQNYWYIISATSRPHGGNYVSNPWAIAAGGTGGNTAAAARTNLSVPAYGSAGSVSGRVLGPSGNVDAITWWRLGATTSANSSGLVPAVTDATNGWGHVGTSTDPWKGVYAKTLNGTLNVSNLSGVVPIGNGGTGGNSYATSANTLKFRSLSNGFPTIPANSDLNTFITYGNYCCFANADAATILNTPFTEGASTTIRAFNLTVESSLRANGIIYVRQILQQFATNEPAFARVTISAGNSWEPWQQMTVEGGVGIAYGGTGATTAEGARTKLTTPTYTVDDSSINAMSILYPNGTPAQWMSQGYRTTNLGGFLPRVSNPSAGWNNLGASAWPFVNLWAKSLNGVLNTSNLSGLVPIGNGGTGANTKAIAANNLSVASIGNGYASLVNGTDLNRITSFGNYGVHIDGTAKTILNTPRGAAASPAARAFNLTVEASIRTNTGNYLRQIFQEHPPGSPKYERSRSYLDTDPWSKWVPVGAGGYATTTVPGLVKIDGTSITINSAGVISSTGGSGGGGYTLPAASASTLGGIKVGSGLSVTADGTLSTTSSSEVIPITRGGTNAITIPAARTSLSVPSYLYLNTSVSTITAPSGSATDVVGWRLGSTTSGGSGGVFPAARDTTNGWGHLGSDSDPWRAVRAKTLNGTLSTSNLSGIVPIGNGGTGANSVAGAANSLMFRSITNGFAKIAAGSDLDTFASFGNYGCETTVAAKAITNTPYDTGVASGECTAFNLTVESSLRANGNSRYIRQIFEEFTGNRPAWVRYSQGGSQVAWGDWLPYTPNGYCSTTQPGLIKLGNGLSISNGSVSVDLNAVTTTLPVTNGGTGANTAAAARTNLGTPAYTYDNTKDLAALMTASAVFPKFLGVGNFTEYDSGIVPMVTDSNGWGVLGTSDTPFASVTARNLYGNLSPNYLTSAVPVGRGGTGATTATTAKSNLGLGQYLGPVGTGSDTQIKSIYRLTEKVYIVESVLNLAATSGTGLQKVGELRLPFNLADPPEGSTTLAGVLQVLSAVVSTGGYVSFNYQDKNTISLHNYSGGGSTAASTARSVLIIASA